MGELEGEVGEIEESRAKWEMGVLADDPSGPVSA